MLLITIDEIRKEELYRLFNSGELDAVKGFLADVEQGNIDGSWYECRTPTHACGCVYGTLRYHQKGETAFYDEDPTLQKERREIGDEFTPLERMVIKIKPGTLPYESVMLRKLVRWTKAYIEAHEGSR